MKTVDITMTPEKWHADIHVSDELVKQCIETQFPALKPLSLWCIGEGWDNKVYLVNHSFVFRFPRRKIALQLIARENAVLPRIKHMIDLAIPNPIYQGKASSIYPYEFQGYEKIEGHSGCHAHLSLPQREQSLPILAKFLKQLHRISEKQALALGSKEPAFDRTDILTVSKNYADHAKKIIERKIALLNWEVLNQELSLAQAIQLPSKKVLVHGDLYCRHLMFEDGKLTGVIDWGDSCVNSPAVDLAVLFSFYPVEHHKLFLSIYGEVDPAIWTYARFLGLYSAINILLYAHDMGDTLLEQEQIGAIKRINPLLLSI